MQFDIRNNSVYKDVSIKYEGTKIDLGLLDEDEVKELVKDLVNAIQELLY